MDSHFLTGVHVKVARAPFVTLNASDVIAALLRPFLLFFHIPGLQPECAGQVFISACRGEGENERAFSLIADGECVARRRPHMLSGGERTGTRIAISGSERGGEERRGGGQTRTDPNSTSAVDGGEG